ncbi:MAG: ABC transporter ATP-binding protein [Sedimenticola sp.]|nr:ABC transporter ATP-binding protein [Sedimenticola sp.]
MSHTPLLSLQGVTRHFGGGRYPWGARRPLLHALQSVSLSMAQGETLGLVGESGCGKSTLARLVVGLDRPSCGRIEWRGEDLADLVRRDRRALARRLQYVFQDPLAALNPRRTVHQALETPLIHLRGLERDARRQHLETLMASVLLEPHHLQRYPHEFSGGQAQRIGIARALAAEPELLVLDEPVSALDVSMQAQVLNLLADLKQQLGLTYLFISHDLSVVERVCDRVAVLYFGQLVELAPVSALFKRPRHPYSDLLLRSAPLPGKPSRVSELQEGDLPDPYRPPAGCPFQDRCPERQARCLREMPPLAPIGDAEGHSVACHFPLG